MVDPDTLCQAVDSKHNSHNYLSADLDRFRSRDGRCLREGDTLRSRSRERLRFLSLSLVAKVSASFLSLESPAIWKHSEGSHRLL